jgi:tetratricopeptide (TPR) repeat protein
MMVVRFLALLTLYVSCCVGLAAAQVPADAQKAFAEGRFVEAAAICETDASADALAFAARAHIADAITREAENCLDCLLRAERAAKSAIERDPKLAEAYTQLAIAIGFRGRLVGTMAAQSESLPEKGRAAIDKALALAPNNVWAQASLGGWHLEIVHRAGAFFASALYGAYEEDGLNKFRQALAADPENLFIQYHFSLTVLALDVERFRAAAKSALDEGVKDTRTDALTQFTRARAAKLRALLDTGSKKQIAGMVRHYQGYPIRKRT